MNAKGFVAPALALSLILTAVVAHADDDDNSSALVTLAQMKQGSLPVTVTAFGQVQPSPTARQTLTAPVATEVTQIAVQNGQVVKKGAPLLTLVPTPETRGAYTLAKQLAVRTASLAKAHLATASDLEKAQSDLTVLEQEGAAGPNTIKAPFDAIVLKVDSGPGAIVNKGDPLVELAKPDGLVVQVGVDPASANEVNPGDAVALTPFSASAKPVQGKVTLRSAVIDTDTGLVPVQIDFPIGKFVVGEMVRAVITVREQTGYVVPHDAILVDTDGTIYVVQDDKMKARKVAVEILATDGDQDVIAGDDLNAAQPIVLTGNYQLDDGTKLRVAEAQGAGSKGAASK
jgi:membrane fusion protein (multidrug efflux system)